MTFTVKDRLSGTRATLTNDHGGKLILQNNVKGKIYIEIAGRGDWFPLEQVLNAFGTLYPVEGKHVRETR